jgi:GH24 family phage-related lysozyme (muramidase)
MSDLRDYWTQSEIRILKNIITLNEGFEPYSYEDTEGNVTVGIGFNLGAPGAEAKIEALCLDFEKVFAGDVPLTREQAEVLLEDEILVALKGAQNVYSNFFDLLSFERQLVVIDIIYSLGRTGYTKFENHISAVKNSEWNKAADEMTESQWCRQVKSRCTRMSQIMRNGDVDGDLAWREMIGYWGLEASGVNSLGTEYRIVSSIIINELEVGANIEFIRYLYNYKNLCSYYMKSRWTFVISRIDNSGIQVTSSPGTCESSSSCNLTTCEAKPFGQPFYIKQYSSDKIGIAGNSDEILERRSSPQTVPDVPIFPIQDPDNPFPLSNRSEKIESGPMEPLEIHLEMDSNICS